MARYNTSVAASSLTGTTTLSSPQQGLFTALTGTPPYTVTLAAPALFLGVSQSFWNNTGGTVTLSTPTGAFYGAGVTTSGGTTTSLANNSFYTFVSDGINYVANPNNGGNIVADSLSMTGPGNVSISPSSTGTLTINPNTTGNINNTNIGATTRGTGAFTTLAANNSVTLNLVTIAASTGTISTSSGNLTITATGTISVSKAVDLGANNITTTYYPTSTSDLTNKNYVDIRSNRVSATNFYLATI